MLLALVNRGEEVPGAVPVAVITIAIVWLVYLLPHLLRWWRSARRRKPVDQGKNAAS
jgi:hypothetical protein